MAVPQSHCAYCEVCAARLHYRRGTKFKAMEFAITVPAHELELTTPGRPAGQEFFVSPGRRIGALRCG
jgi:hypothetical protein